ncbi:hypothetical protein [Streptomyces purpurascens]|uniref:Uncharacterized protein n=1 Tax=Streptomyces purpurascens TaxID=1924 RepID=A0ABZ1MN85_STREF|nr:hypothetical protein [Streptomyces purpurascens]MCE7049492.1 hypothetical protein [Streptomyces purpurascens]GHA22056.1 hypothetical protein GCM10010303_35690 [Streptomyces purpurascens]
MSVEESSGAPPVPPDDLVVSVGLEIAMKWGAALGGPEQLKVALAALEPQLKRDHQVRLRHLDMQRDAAARKDENARAAAERELRLAREKRQHALRMTGLYMGAVISIAMLGAGIYVARDVWWLAIMLCGPSLIAMGKLYVLRRSDREDMRAVARSARSAMNAAGQAQPPPVP